MNVATKERADKMEQSRSCCRPDPIVVVAGNSVRWLLVTYLGR